MKKELPLIELTLENVTYAPTTAMVGPSNKKAAKPKSGKEDLRMSTADSTAFAVAQKRNVLNNITTTIAPYRLTAWMGPSGSGKTSLISVAAHLTKPGDIVEGSVIMVNGEEGTVPKNLVGVVWQDDLLLSNLTVEENLYFAARLKTPKDITDDEVRANVEETMSELSLLNVRHSLVGSPMGPIRGISGGERKRVSVGIELVERPSLLLLDEPTSGLDATTAQSLISTLKDLTQKGHSIAVVIHQPRTTIYNMFDHLLVLSKGNMLYDGHPSGARGYLESCPSVPRLPPETGIADWLMDIIIEDENLGLEKRYLPGRWDKLTVQQKDEYKRPLITEEITTTKDDGPTGAITTNGHTDYDIEKGRAESTKILNRRLSSLRELNAAPKYSIGFWKQLRLVTYRTVKQQRGEKLTATALIVQCAYLFFTALFWWRLPNNTERIFERNSLFFFILIAQANGIVTSAVTVFQRERTLLKRERAKKMYRVSSFFVAKTISDMSNNVLLPVLYGCIAYWTAGYRPTAAAYFKFLFSFYWALSTAQSMGLYLSVLIPNPIISLVLAPPITLFFMILGGFYIPLKSMNIAVRWASYLSFARYSYSSMIVNEYEGRIIPCPPDGGTNCPLAGDDVISGLGIDGVNANYWFNVGMVIILQVFFRFAAYAVLRRSK